MKHIYKHFIAAALLWAGMATSAQAQFVINYQNSEGVQETATSDLLKVDQNGNSFLVNQIEINRVNYISRFVSDNTNEGKIDIPEESSVKLDELTVISGENEVKVDANGNFQTTSNNLTAYNKEGKVVYRSYVTMESGNQMCSAQLNAEETAVSLLMPMFSSIFQGMTDEVMTHIKTMILELPETQVLAKAIDKCIASNGYLDMDIISAFYEAAATEVAHLSGLDQVNTARANAGKLPQTRKAGKMNEKVTKDGITIMLKNLEKATIERTNGLGSVLQIEGYKGTFDVWNTNRLAYSLIAIGKKKDNGSVVYNLLPDNQYLLPPVQMGQFVDANTTWSDIRSFLTGKSDAGKSAYGNAYTESKVSDVLISLASNDDAILVMGPQTIANLRYYNVARAYLEMVVADILGTTDAKSQDELFKGYYSFFASNYYIEPNPDNPDYPNQIYYFQTFNNIDSNSELSPKEKAHQLFDITFKALQEYLTTEGAKFSNAAAEKVFANKDFYRAIITQIGDKSMYLKGLDEGNTGIHVEGLDIVLPKLSEQALYREATALYNNFVATGNGKMGPVTELFYKGMWQPGLSMSLDLQHSGWDRQWNTLNTTNSSADIANYYRAAYSIIDYANELLTDLEYNNISSLSTLEGEARALRDFMYMYLVETWGCVPLANGQTVGSDIELLDLIIEDLQKAADQLNWQPRLPGCCTKGMALSYLGEAYLWKAYRQRANGQDDKASVNAAKDALKKVIDSGYYALVSSYESLWGREEAWPNEAVWQFVNELGSIEGSEWSRQDWTWMQFYAAATMCGGWGSLSFPWELFFLFEQGDLRRDASFCTAAVPNLPEQYRGAGYGKNPYLGQTIDHKQYKWGGGDYAPAVWTLKHWRLKMADWSSGNYCPVHIYFKRYAGVLMDYAECLFRLNGGDDEEAWGIVDNIRSRAFGGQAPEDAKTYYTRMTDEGMKIDLTGTPEFLCLPFAGKAEPWQVALGQEKRKEFNAEWNLRADLQRLDFMQAHFDCNYPKNMSGELEPDNWHTPRNWDFNPDALVLPILEQ